MLMPWTVTTSAISSSTSTRSARPARSRAIRPGGASDRSGSSSGSFPARSWMTVVTVSPPWSGRGFGRLDQVRADVLRQLPVLLAAELPPYRPERRRGEDELVDGAADDQLHVVREGDAQ